MRAVKSIKKGRTGPAKRALKKLLDSKMTAYSAAAGAVFAGGAAARAGIVYTSVDVTLIWSSCEIDFLNDGSHDVFLSQSAMSDIDSWSRGSSGSYTTTKTNYVRAEGRFMVDSSNMVSALAAGAPIGEASDFSNTIANWSGTIYMPFTVTAPYSSRMITNTWTNTSSSTGNFLGTTGKYLGVTIVDGTNEYYGWIQIDVGDLAEEAHISGYAYNDTPGGPIDAGEIPEPGSLALLALGAAGVAARRRKRAQ